MGRILEAGEPYALVTRARAGEFDCCRRLVAAVASRLPEILHVLAVERREEPRYAALASRRTWVVPFEALLPSWLRRVPWTDLWIGPGGRPVRPSVVEALWPLVADRAAHSPVLVSLDPWVRLPPSFDPAAVVRGGRWPLAGPRLPTAGAAAQRAGRLAARLLDLPVERRYAAWVSTPVADWRRDHIDGLRRHVLRVTGRPLEENVVRLGGPPAHLLYGLYVQRILGAQSGHYVLSRRHDPRRPAAGA